MNLRDWGAGSADAHTVCRCKGYPVQFHRRWHPFPSDSPYKRAEGFSNHQKVETRDVIKKHLIGSSGHIIKPNTSPRMQQVLFSLMKQINAEMNTLIQTEHLPPDKIKSVTEINHRGGDCNPLSNGIFPFLLMWQDLLDSLMLGS